MAATLKIFYANFPDKISFHFYFGSQEYSLGFIWHTFVEISLPKSNENLWKLIHWSKAFPYIFITFITSSHSRVRPYKKKDQKKMADTEGLAHIFPRLTIHEDFIFDSCDSLHDPFNPCGWETHFPLLLGWSIIPLYHMFRRICLNTHSFCPPT